MITPTRQRMLEFAAEIAAERVAQCAQVAARGIERERRAYVLAAAVWLLADEDVTDAELAEAMERRISRNAQRERDAG